MVPRRTGLPLVAVSAALWGSDALFRRGLALELPAATVVLYEHLILTLIVAPLLFTIPWRRLTGTDVVCLLVIGAGASALATVLFTSAFRYGDPNSPLLLQKLQPFAAVVAARWLLGERPGSRFAAFFATALVAAWLVTFPDPLQIRPENAVAGALAAGAALLWGLGTVLGRRMSHVLSVSQLTAARFGIGLPAALLPFLISPATFGAPTVPVGALPSLLLLALIPGLLALALYYRGLQRTPASAAAVAELAFPVSALTINYVVFGATLTPTQLAGVVALCGVLVAMAVVARTPAGVGVDVAPEEGVLEDPRRPTFAASGDATR